MFSITDEVKVASTIVPLVLNDDTEGTGTAVDIRGYASIAVIFLIGNSADTLSGSVKLELFLQHSDVEGSGYTNVEASDVIGTQGYLIDAPAEDQVVVTLGYYPSRRYLRAFIDTTGTHTSGTLVAAVALLSNSGYLPAA